MQPYLCGSDTGKPIFFGSVCGPYHLPLRTRVCCPCSSSRAVSRRYNMAGSGFCGSRFRRLCLYGFRTFSVCNRPEKCESSDRRDCIRNGDRLWNCLCAVVPWGNPKCAGINRRGCYSKRCDVFIAESKIDMRGAAALFLRQINAPYHQAYAPIIFPNCSTIPIFPFTDISPTFSQIRSKYSNSLNFPIPSPHRPSLIS